VGCGSVFSKALPKTDDEGGLQLTAFSNADMVGDIDGRRSTSGVLVFLGSALISLVGPRTLAQVSYQLSSTHTLMAVG
jgi:hypothetical protein